MKPKLDNLWKKVKKENVNSKKLQFYNLKTKTQPSPKKTQIKETICSSHVQSISKMTKNTKKNKDDHCPQERICNLFSF